MSLYECEECGKSDYDGPLSPSKRRRQRQETIQQTEAEQAGIARGEQWRKDNPTSAARSASLRQIMRRIAENNMLGAMGPRWQVGAIGPLFPGPAPNDNNDPNRNRNREPVGKTPKEQAETLVKEILHSFAQAFTAPDKPKPEKGNSTMPSNRTCAYLDCQLPAMFAAMVTLLQTKKQQQAGERQTMVVVNMCQPHWSLLPADRSYDKIKPELLPRVPSDD